MQRWEVSLSAPNVCCGSTSEVTATFRNFRFGRKADVSLCNTQADLWRDSVLNGSICDFRSTPKNRHDIGDVAFHPIYFRCRSGSGSGRKALPTAESGPEPSIMRASKESAYRPQRTLVASCIRNDIGKVEAPIFGGSLQLRR